MALLLDSSSELLKNCLMGVCIYLHKGELRLKISGRCSPRVLLPHDRSMLCDATALYFDTNIDIQ